jgi:glycosyltransferase involved in cell wall biosynthesis
MHEIWPDAPLYTSVASLGTAKWAKKFIIKTSFVQKIPFARKHHEWFAWLMPYAFEAFSFRQYDVVISVTSAEAKGIITGDKTLHISYLLTPTRYLWSHTHLYLTGNYATNSNPLTRKLTPIFFSQLRRWDYLAAQRPDKLIAISKTVSRRINKYYRREPAALIYPPVATVARKTKVEIEVKEPYYLVVSRLVPYKRIDIAIEAFNRLGRKLVIIGTGADKDRLKKLGCDNVVFLGKIPQKKLAAYYQHASAVIFPSEEDFGIVAVEAQSAGKPVIAYKSGGAAETIINNQTGILFDRQDPEAVIKAVLKLDKLKIDPNSCKINARRFSVAKFKRSLLQFVEESWSKHQLNQ